MKKLIFGVVVLLGAVLFYAKAKADDEVVVEEMLPISIAIKIEESKQPAFLEYLGQRYDFVYDDDGVITLTEKVIE